MRLLAAFALRPVKKILLGLWTASCLIVSAPTPEVPGNRQIKVRVIRGIETYLL